MRVTLPDGTPLELDDGATGADAAAAIGPGLAKAALAVKQQGTVRDLAAPLVPDEDGALHGMLAPEGAAADGTKKPWWKMW